jgi:hypothetical protein
MNMTPVSFAILIVLSMVGLWIFVTLGSLPGKTATERNHPQAEAINILGWLGLLFGGVGWMVAMVWARMKPIFPPAVAETTAPAAAGDSDAPTQEAS